MRSCEAHRTPQPDREWRNRNVSHCIKFVPSAQEGKLSTRVPIFRDDSPPDLHGTVKSTKWKTFSILLRDGRDFSPETLKLRKTVFVNYRNYETLLAMRSDDALASAFVAFAQPGFRTRCRGPARKPHFCRFGQKWAESTGVLGPQVQHLPKRGVFAKIWIPPKGNFRATDGFWAGYNAVCPPERGGCGG